jgi:hypothetical protein
MRVRVDQSWQHRAVAEVHDPRAGGQGPARYDPRDAVPRDNDVDVVLNAAAAVEDGRGAEQRGVLSRYKPRDCEES